MSFRDRPMKELADIDPVISEYVNLAYQGRCPICAKTIKTGEFRDALSEKEFDISGLCQTCQDSIFGAEE